MFVDQVKVFARAGKGGKGCVAFHREAYIAKGGPSGGNGGRGGDVIIEADHDRNNLIEQYYKPRLLAEHGEAGMGKGMDGHAGSDLIIKVPCGTLIWKLPDDMAPIDTKSVKPVTDDDEEEAEEVEEEEEPASQPMKLATSSRTPIIYSGRERAMEVQYDDEDEEEVSSTQHGGAAIEGAELVADLTEHGQRFVLCKGGRGGLGNRNFATAARQTPRFAQPGETGDEGNYLFELRIMADVGLVGYPNAGKSTLLTAISRAKPKVAPYPFTTLHPQPGIVEYADYKRITVCDIPGIIEGAHNNVGLGYEFLRHIKRCKVLVILLDMAGTDGREPWDDYKQLLSELDLYDPEMLERPRLVVANKMDEPQAEENLKKFKRKIRKVSVLPIAAAFDEGIEKFKLAIREAVEEASVDEEKEQ